MADKKSEVALLLGLMSSGDGGVTKLKKSREPFMRYPVPLVKRAAEAMSHLKSLIKLFDIQRDPLDLLNEYREEKKKGILFSPYFLNDFLADRSERNFVINKISLLDDALVELFSYNPEDYLTEASYRLANRKSAAQRSRDDVLLIKNKLRNRYLPAGHGMKGKIKKEISNEYDISESGLDALIKQLKGEVQS